MKVTELVAIYQGLQKIKDKALPVKVSYAINRNLKRMMPEVEAFDDSRMNVVRKYARKKEDGSYDADEKGNVQIDDVPACNKEISVLCDSEVTGVEFVKVPLAELEKCDTADFDALTVSEMEILDFMIDE